jgi:metal-responsive CopG/Arc/MetJ family transcriptional regulator
MKTIVSIPVRLFLAAERHAHRTRTSRSRLYTAALREYLLRHDPGWVTDEMNRVVDHLDTSEPEPFVRQASLEVLARTEW